MLNDCELNGNSNVSTDIRAEAREVSVCNTPSSIPQKPFDSKTIDNRKTIIIRGSKSQSDKSFTENRGKQCTAMAAAALAASKVRDPKEWSSAFIDSLLIDGNNLYTNSLDTRTPPVNEIGNTEYLTPTELAKEFEIYSDELNYPIRLSILNEYFGDLDIDHEEAFFPNLKTRLTDLLKNDVSLILTSNGISVAIFKKDKNIWMSDSHKRNALGLQCPKGTACLVGFVDVQSLLKVLRHNIPRGSDTDNSYMITEIQTIIVTEHQHFQVLSKCEGSAVASYENGDVYVPGNSVSPEILFQEEDFIPSLYPPCKRLKVNFAPSTSTEVGSEIESRIETLRIKENTIVPENDYFSDNPESDTTFKSGQVSDTEEERFSSSSEESDTASVDSFEFVSKSMTKNIEDMGYSIVDVLYFSSQVQYMIIEHRNNCTSFLNGMRQKKI